jgi:hypothetical protein
MEDNIQSLILRTSQSIKELKIVNENIKVLNKKVSKIVFDEKKYMLHKFLIKHPKKYYMYSS